VPNPFGLAGPGSRWKNTLVDPAGFWAGLWHGLIMGLAFLASLVWSDIGIYESRNKGRWYDLGFFLGSGAFFSSTISIS
jgi:hypothetical protein